MRHSGEHSSCFPEKGDGPCHAECPLPVAFCLVCVTCCSERGAGVMTFLLVLLVSAATRRGVPTPAHALDDLEARLAAGSREPARGRRVPPAGDRHRALRSQHQAVRAAGQGSARRRQPLREPRARQCRQGAGVRIGSPRAARPRRARRADARHRARADRPGLPDSRPRQPLLRPVRLPSHRQGRRRSRDGAPAVGGASAGAVRAAHPGRARRRLLAAEPARQGARGLARRPRARVPTSTGSASAGRARRSRSRTSSNARSMPACGWTRRCANCFPI